MISEECLLWKKELRFNFIGWENYGVSWDSKFVLSVLNFFLRGIWNYTDCTYTNHNNKSSRYQLVIGGNNDKMIVIYIIDSGLFNKAEIAHDLFRPEDFASKYLVLCLASVDNMHDILALDCPDPHS